MIELQANNNNNIECEIECYICASTFRFLEIRL